MKMKWTMVLVLVAVMLVAIPGVVAAEEPVLTLVEGDANLDGKTNIIDAMVIAQYTVDPTGEDSTSC